MKFYEIIYYIVCTKSESLPEIWGNREIRPFISEEQGNKSKKLKGTGEQRQFWGRGNIENQYFDFGEQGKKLIFFSGEQGNRYPPWEGLKSGLQGTWSA